MSGGYNPKVAHPNLRSSQLTSKVYQTPFFFGGSQVPSGLMLPKDIYNGSKGEGIASARDLIRPIHTIRDTKGLGVYHRKAHNIKRPKVLPFM
jgi:hypothetical protein